VQTRLFQTNRLLALDGVQSITGQLKTPAEVAKQMEADVKAARGR
jgi:hypothetical protein